MKILFDHQAFILQTQGGVSRCFAELYKHLPIDVETRISVTETDNVYLNAMGIGKPICDGINNFIDLPCYPVKCRMFAAYKHFTEGLPYKYKNDYNWTYQNQNELNTIKQLKEGNFDIFHPTFFDDYFLPYLNNKPFVLTIHDMIPELYPQYFDGDRDRQILGKKKLAPLARAIIAVSENTKEDIVRILKVPEEKVHVIYHGSGHIVFDSQSTCERNVEFTPNNEPFILYVGNRRSYKNFNLFVDEIVSTLKCHSELKVICTGSEFNDEEITHLYGLGLQDRFIHRWVETDEEFALLYNKAFCFVYTSEYEGFGIPILEAYKADCPVMLNRASCFPEIAGDAAIYFTLSKEGSDFNLQFEKLYSMTSDQREQLLQKQRERLKLYSWEKSAKQLAAVYKTII